MSTFADKIIRWYKLHQRSLPWRFQHVEGVDLYRTWLSEIMLQQTTVPTVLNYYPRFLAKWPSVQDLASATEQEVLTEWQGLGYYSRARNLLKCAQYVVAHYNGVFPRDEKSLLKLPGIGPYTASAILAIGADKKSIAVDGNIERIMARLHALERPLRDIKKELYELSAKYVPERGVSCYTQGLMDLGAMVCTPTAPKCDICPVQNHCLAFKKGIANELPTRLEKKQLPEKFTHSFFHVDEEKIQLRRRENENLLKGMIELPSLVWKTDPIHYHVSHTFSHFHIRIQVSKGRPTEEALNGKEFWHPISELHKLPIPTMTKKVLRYGGINI